MVFVQRAPDPLEIGQEQLCAMHMIQIGIYLFSAYRTKIDPHVSE